MAAVRRPDMGRYARQRDNRPAAAAQHMRNRGLRENERAVEGHRQDLPPFSQLHLKERRLPPQPGIADQDVNPAEGRDRIGGPSVRSAPD